ncbi:MAG: FAD-dependent oxidoreductase [Alphaproteobacteria bacterium]|nr:FAD-dependent oxidoreductase [Alphaproteobacteria bacterium]
MSRTPLFAALRRALALSAAARGGKAPPLDELADPAFAATLRRRALLRGAAGMAGAALLGANDALAQTRPPRPAVRLTQGAARIAVVGAGLAGLAAAHRLVAAGARDVTVYEANGRVGGRMFTGRDVVGEGTTVELGGSFINTEHADIVALAREFNLPLEDGAQGADAALATSYFVAGAHRSIAEIAEAGAEMVRRLEAMRAEPDDAKARHDRLSAAAMMDQLGVRGWLRTLLDVGLAQEMGLDPGDMSALYLVESFAPDPRQPRRGLFSSDQRFQIEGGNDRLTSAIAASLGPRVRLRHRLEAVRRRGAAYALTFAAEGRRREVIADIVIMTLPLTILRGLPLDVGLSPLARRAVREIAYGTNAKLFAGMGARPWRAQGRSGECISDLGFQAVWEDHGKPASGAGGGPGALTIFAGGAVGRGFGQGRAADRARAVATALDAAFPGAATAFTGRASRMFWPGNPYVGGSYTCYAPGQWTGFSGAFAPAGRFIFAGEHTSEDYSGYMNGGAESGRVAAEAVARILA